MRITADDLSDNSALTGLVDDELDLIARHCTERVLRRGEYLYRRGDEPDEVYFQLTGVTRAVLQLGGRRPLLIHTSLPGDGTQGLRDVLVARPRSTTVVAHEPSRFAVLRAADALDLLHRYPSMLWASVREMSEGLDGFAQHAADIGVLDLPRRVAKDLLDPAVSAPHGREPQLDMALRLGAARQSVNKALTMLSLRGWIERHDDGTFGVRDLTSVRRFVDGAPAPRASTRRASSSAVTDQAWDARGHVLQSVADAPALAALRAASRVSRFEPGDTIHHEGEHITHLVVLIEGEGLLSSDSGGRGTHVHDTVAVDGTMRGLTSLFREGPPTVSLRAQRAVCALEIPRAALAAMLRSAPDALLVAAREIADALSGFMHTAAELAVLRSTARVARVLLAHSDEAGNVVLPLTQQQIAVRLGLTRQSVNRALTELRDNNLIGSAPTHYAIHDRAALHRFVYLEDA